MIDGGLVLEGGGMRGVYTAGVLDWLMDRGIWLSRVYGVSAGACHGTSYVSRQRGRAIRTVLDYAGDARYAGLGNLLRTGNFFGERFIYEDIPRQLVPFDYDAYAQSGMTLYSVLFNCRTGEVAYPAARDMRADMPLILASSSLPLLSKMVVIDGEPYLDGGIADSIPAQRAARENARCLIVLTRHRGYTKRPMRAYRAIAVAYRRYPALVQALRVRHQRYNDQLALAYALEARGRAVIIQPSMPVGIRAIERDAGRLRALYEQGLRDAQAARDAVLRVFPEIGG